MKKLWGERFKSELHDLAKEFSYSLGVDFELLDAEVRVSIAHATMLGKSGIISHRDSRLLVRGLRQVLATLKKKVVCELIRDYEDIHTLIQVQLEKKIGRVGKKLHTARSRNDLVSTSTRIYVRERIQDLLILVNLMLSGKKTIS